MQKNERTYPYWQSFILSSYAWAATGFFTSVFMMGGFIFGIPLSLIVDRVSRSPIHWVSQIWAKSIIWTSPFWSYEAKGLENIKPGEQYIIVSNHQSILDILLLLAVLPINYKFLAKQELFRIPFLGWHMHNANYIPLDRGSLRSSKEALIRARKWVRLGISVLLFPEGTRSRDGQIHEFRAGAFKMAQKDKVKILPVIADRTGEALPKNSLVARKNTKLLLTILEPVVISEDDDAEQKGEAIRQKMIAALNEMRAGL